MSPFLSVEGTITNILPTQTTSTSWSSCTLMITVMTDTQGEVNLTADSRTFVLNQQRLRIGDRIIAFYDGSAPVPLIYPPQYRPVAIARVENGQQYALDYFDQNLINSTKSLRLTPSASTSTVLPNGLGYMGVPYNHYLFVVYGASTRSIPAITTPYQIVVFCQS